MRISTPERPAIRSLLMLFGAAVIGGAWWMRHLRAARPEQLHHDAADEHRDRTLQDSFPASDAPASHDFAIPINAR